MFKTLSKNAVLGFRAAWVLVVRAPTFETSISRYRRQGIIEMRDPRSRVVGCSSDFGPARLSLAVVVLVGRIVQRNIALQRAIRLHFSQSLSTLCLLVSSPLIDSSRAA